MRQDLQNASHPCLREQTMQQRAQAVQDFISPAHESKVLVTSLRTGGQALNLQTASKVIMINFLGTMASAMQAAARVHRIGQEKKVEIVLLLA